MRFDAFGTLTSSYMTTQLSLTPSRFLDMIPTERYGRMEIAFAKILLCCSHNYLGIRKIENSGLAKQAETAATGYRCC